MDDVNDFLSKGYSERKVIRVALNKNRHVLDEMWDTESNMGTDEGSESEEEERRMTTMTIPMKLDWHFTFVL